MVSNMIKRLAFYLMIFSSLFFLGYFTFNIFVIKERDIKKYNNILKRNSKLTACEALKREPLLQKRKNVQKDIFISQNGTRLHYRIFSDSSTICFTEKKAGIEFVETLKNLKCLVQDKIYLNPEKNCFFQQLRYFTAKEGNYIYPSHKFVSDSIRLSFFDIPGKTLPNDISTFEPYLKGFANEVSFHLTDTASKLTAQHFRASIDMGERK